MPKDMGMIAFGMVQALKKQVKKLEADVEEIKSKAPQQIREEDLRRINSVGSEVQI